MFKCCVMPCRRQYLHPFPRKLKNTPLYVYSLLYLQFTIYHLTIGYFQIKYSCVKFFCTTSPISCTILGTRHSYNIIYTSGWCSRVPKTNRLITPCGLSNNCANSQFVTIFWNQHVTSTFHWPPYRRLKLECLAFKLLYSNGFMFAEWTTTIGVVK